MPHNSPIIRFLLITHLISSILIADAIDSQDFKPLFNGKNLNGWYLKIRANDEALAQQVFVVEDGTVHVFNKNFPDEYELDTGENKTHGLMYTDKKYSKYHLRFEYKWGHRIANNFKRWQYDAGVYYHVTDDTVWPIGIEYQIRYNHLTGLNHSGDLIRPKGANYEWYCEPTSKSYLHPDEGGIKPPQKMWYHHASPIENFHGLDDGWNVCEIIAMGDEYAIHKLNGEVVNMLFHPSPSEGIIGFQAETAEIYYRKIEIKEFSESLDYSTFM
jgi:hypothetical protein